MISIIVPIRNEKKFIGSCLDSIIKQSVNEPAEILISDGDGGNFLNVTYGSQPSDETDSYYLYHTTEDLTSTDNVYITGTYPTITVLDPNYLFPAQIQLGWASSDNGQWGGAAYWGFEEDYFAVR